MTKKRYTVIYNEQCKMMQYVDNCKEEPNKWSTCNIFGTLKKLNEFHEENKSLKNRIGFLEEFITSGVEYTYSQNVYEENKQLRKEIGDLGTAHAEEINKIEDEFDEEILKLEKENEKLREINEWLWKKIKELDPPKEVPITWR